jgi:hypothetical protein
MNAVLRFFPEAQESPAGGLDVTLPSGFSINITFSAAAGAYVVALIGRRGEICSAGFQSLAQAIGYAVSTAIVYGGES